MTECDGNCSECGVSDVEQPPDDREWVTADGIFVKQLYIAKAGTLVPQHSHKYGHASMLATGAVRIWQDGILKGDEVAPVAIFIAAGVKHAFLSLVDNTIIYCIHNLHGLETVQVADEHQLQGVI